jgi:hypothetical protein
MVHYAEQLDIAFISFGQSVAAAVIRAVALAATRKCWKYYFLVKLEGFVFLHLGGFAWLGCLSAKPCAADQMTAYTILNQ